MIAPQSYHPGLRATAEGILGPMVSVGVTDPTAGKPGALFLAERNRIGMMVPKRQREFAAGREAVRQASTALGERPFALPQRTNRAPDWPTNLVGSITHCDSACIAVLAPKVHVTAIGIDVEQNTALPACLEAEICYPEDTSRGTRPRGLAFDRLIFSAKEAAYKCQYPISGQVMGFDQMAINVDFDSATFTARFLADIGTFTRGTQLNGHFAMAGSFLLTGAMIAAPVKGDTVPAKVGERLDA